MGELAKTFDRIESNNPPFGELTLGQNSHCAKNHAICDGASVVAEVLGGGYPIGKGWAPHTERAAHELVRRANAHSALVAALESIATTPKNGEPEEPGSPYVQEWESESSIQRLHEIIALARAAIAKAEGH